MNRVTNQRAIAIHNKAVDKLNASLKNSTDTELLAKADSLREAARKLSIEAYELQCVVLNRMNADTCKSILEKHSKRSADYG
jgi:hypothetical protein